MTAAVWAALLGGALGGSIVTAGLTAITTRANWRREDRHRFSEQKQQAFVEFVGAWREVELAYWSEHLAIETYEADKADMEARDRVSKATEAMMGALRVALHAAGTIELIADRATSAAIPTARTVVQDGVERFPELDGFLAAAREELGLGINDKQVAEGRWAQWRRKREGKKAQ